MSETIEGLWRDGKIIPLEDVDAEENTKVTITFPEEKRSHASLLSLAGVWKNDTPTYNLFREVYNKRGKFKLRKWPIA